TRFDKRPFRISVNAEWVVLVATAEFPPVLKFSEEQVVFGKPSGYAANACRARNVQHRSVVMRNGLTEEDQLVRPEEAAVLLALSRRTLRRYELNGKLHPIKLNQRVTRYRMSELWRLIGKEER